MNEGKRYHDNMHVGMTAMAYSMGPGGFPAIVVVASVIIGGLAFMQYLGNEFYGPLSVLAGTVGSWFGHAGAYEKSCRYGGPFLALALFMLPHALLTYRAWRRKRSGRTTLLSFPVTASILGVALVAAALSANVPSQTFLAIHTPGASLSQKATCMAEVPKMLKGFQRPGITLADCGKYYDVATMDDVCRDSIRRMKPLKYPMLSCEDSARRMTGLSNWPVDRTLPAWMTGGRIVHPDTASDAPAATAAQMQAALRAKGMAPLVD